MNLDSLFLEARPLIDVRAPVEFAQGHLPGAVNLPLLNDEERAEIGTTYKNSGGEVAIARGHELISGEVRQNRIRAWLDFLSKNPGAYFYCYRGGLRSQISRQWTAEAGIERPLIPGGYKAVRNYLTEKIHQLSTESHFLVVCGPTGAGKTKLLQSLKQSSIDLEELANHRGSAFGKRKSAQPSQANFENQLAVTLLRRHQSRCLLVEDESRTIGKIFLPASTFEKMRQSDVIWIDEPMEVRVENILEEYVRKTELGNEVFDSFERALTAISNRLGGLRTQEVSELILTARATYLESGDLSPNKAWIEKLLTYYYDPLYLSSFERRKPNVAFRGSHQACREYLQQVISSGGIT